MKNKLEITVVTFVLVVIAAMTAFSQDMGKVRQLGKEESDRYLQQMKTQNSYSHTTMEAPATVIETIGSSYTGIFTYGYNAVDLPDGTVMIATKGSTLTGPQETLSAVQFGGTFPAGQFRYPMDNARKSDWTTRPDILVYQLFTFFPNGRVSTTTAYKMLVKYWSGQVGPPKFILGGSSVSNFGSLALNITTNLPSDMPVSIVIRDSETDYNMTAIPQSAIKRKGNQIVVNASLAGYQAGPNADIMVVVAGANGLSDQILIRGPVEQVVLPAAQ